MKSRSIAHLFTLRDPHGPIGRPASGFSVATCGVRIAWPHARSFATWLASYVRPRSARGFNIHGICDLLNMICVGQRLFTADHAAACTALLLHRDDHRQASSDHARVCHLWRSSQARATCVARFVRLRSLSGSHDLHLSISEPQNACKVLVWQGCKVQLATRFVRRRLGPQ